MAMTPLETLYQLEFSADVDRVGDTRVAVTELLRKAGIYSHIQLIDLIECRNNRVELGERGKDDKTPLYIVTYQSKYAWLVVFNLAQNFRTSFCWWRGCRVGHSTGNRYLLCDAHRIEYKRDVLPTFRVDGVTGEGINYEEFMSQFTQCDMTALIPNTDVVENGLICNALCLMTKFTKNINMANFNPFHSGTDKCGLNAQTKKSIADYIRASGTVGVRNLRFSYNYTDSNIQYSMWNGKEWSPRRLLCKSPGCCAPAVELLPSCKWCGKDEWKPLVFKALLEVVGKQRWTELTDEDLPLIQTEIEASDKKRITINRYLYITYYSPDDALIANYCTGVRRFICANFDGGCQRLFKREQGSGNLCDKCDTSFVFAAALIHYKPLDGWACVLVKRGYHIKEYNYRLALKYLACIKSDVSSEDFTVVREEEFYNDRRAAAAVVSGTILYIIYIQDFFTKETTNLLNQYFNVTYHSWRYVKTLSTQVGLKFVDKVTELQFEGTVDELIDHDFKFENRDPYESRPWVYRTPIKSPVYYGLNESYGWQRKTIIANCHAGTSSVRAFECVRQHMISSGLLTATSELVGVLIGICKDPSLVSGKGIETISLSAAAYGNEMYDSDRVITNRNYSTTNLPRDKALPALQRAVLHEYGFTFKVKGQFSGSRITTLPRHPRIPDTVQID